MSFQLLCIALVSAFLIFFTVIQLIRRQRLSEEYSSMWLLVSALIITSALLSERIIVVYSWFKGDDGSGYEILLFFALVFLVFMLMYMSVKLSDYKKNIVRLSQEIGLLKSKM